LEGPELLMDQTKLRTGSMRGWSLLILEGPELLMDQTKLRTGSMRGWRHYQFITRHKTSTCIGHPDRMQFTAASLAAAFFKSGTWEDLTKPVPPDTMPVPRPEILAEIHPKNHWQDQLQFA